MLFFVGMGIVGAAVLLFAAIGLVSNWRRFRKESAAKKKAPGDSNGETLCGWRHQTGADWRQRP